MPTYQIKSKDRDKIKDDLQTLIDTTIPPAETIQEFDTFSDVDVTGSVYEKVYVTIVLTS